MGSAHVFAREFDSFESWMIFLFRRDVATPDLIDRISGDNRDRGLTWSIMSNLLQQQWLGGAINNDAEWYWRMLGELETPQRRCTLAEFLAVWARIRPLFVERPEGGLIYPELERARLEEERGDPDRIPAGSG